MTGLEFKPVALEHRAILEPLFRAAPDRGCEYTFGNLFIWRSIYDTSVAFTDDGMCVVRFAQDVGANAAYLFPVGDGDLKSAFDAMLSYSAERGEHFTVIAARKEDCDALETLYGERFAFHTSRDFAEYVYNTTDLIELKGKKYHGKRNHLARFREENPDYAFIDITRENIGEVRAMNDVWYKEVFEEEGRDPELTDEHRSVDEAFDNYFELGFSGGYLTDGSKIVGYSMGEPINGTTFCVHIEKACYNTTGAYTMVNREFCERFCGDYLFVNREDDVGDEGLRRAKLSYYPAEITEKYVVHEK